MSSSNTLLKKASLPLIAVIGAGFVLSYLQSPDDSIVTPTETPQSLQEPASISKMIQSQETLHAKKGAIEGVKQVIKPVQYGDYQSIYGPLPSSLEGAPLPTGLSIDAQGQLVPTVALQRLFDFFLTTVGEEPLERVIERINEYLAFQLEEPALSQAKGILENYQAMKTAMIEMEQNWSEEIEMTGDRPEFQAIVDRKRDLRREFLGEEVYQAFFETDEKLDNYMLQKLTILKDDTLTEPEKQARLTEIEALLPEKFQEKKAQERQLDNFYQEVEQAKSQGASEQDIYQMRLETLGAEKADRYQQAERAQQSWDDRVTVYREERQQILDSGLSAQDQADQIQALREMHFEGRELMRIPVIDRMKDTQ